MKKMLFVSVFLSLFVNLSAADNALMSYVPKEANALVSVDCGKIVNLPFFKDMRKKGSDFDKSYMEVESKLKAQGLQMDKLVENALIYAATDKQTYGSIFKTQVKEAQMEKLFTDMASPIATVDTNLIKGKKVFILKGQDYSNPFSSAMMQGALPERLSAMIYLKEDVVLFTEKDKLQNLLNLAKNGNVSSNKKLMDRKAFVGKNALLWVIFEMPEQKVQAKPADASSAAPVPETDKIKGGSLSLAFTGPESRDISVDSSIECKDAQSAMMYAMQAQGAIMMTVSMSLSDKPQLAADIGNSIKIEAKDKNIIAKLTISKALQDSIGKLVEEKQKATSAVPQTIPFSPAKTPSTAPASGKAK